MAIIMVRHRFLLVLASVGACCWLMGAGDPPVSGTDLNVAQDERWLKSAGIPVDGPGLIDYFRRRTPTDAEQVQLKQRAAQLGSSLYPVRAKATDDLIRAGRTALPYLRETTRHEDPETARRAAYCIGVIEQNTSQGLSAYAARVLVSRHPEGAVEVLLAYLPFADDSWVEEQIRTSLQRIAYADGRAGPEVEKAARDAEPKRRAAAAWLLGHAAEEKQRKAVLPLLRDASTEVRFLAASALLSSREPAAVPPLIGLLTATPHEYAWRAEDLLFRLADEKGPAVWLDTAKDNNGRKVQAAWEEWWTDNQSRIDWKSLKLEDQALGLTLIVENQRPDGTGRLFEINKSGDLRWQVKVPNPIDAQWLPGGRILVGDSRSSLIYEMDTRGSITWKHAGIAPTSVQRLPNGNTVCSTYQKIIEFTRDGKIVFEYPTQGHTYHARKLPDNHYVWIDACGEIGEVDPRGSLVAKTKVGAGLAWGSIERLRNGRYLVALGGIGKVQEMDMSGKVFWERIVSNPNRAIRLLNGNTLVASHGDGCIYEFDANGNERWKHACAGRPFAVVRR